MYVYCFHFSDYLRKLSFLGNYQLSRTYGRTLLKRIFFSIHLHLAEPPKSKAKYILCHWWLQWQRYKQ